MPRLTKTVRRDPDKRRRQLAAMAERCAIPERPSLGRGPRYLIHPHVSIECGPVLSGIARDLRDETLRIDCEVLHGLATFLQGPDSSLFELDPVVAVGVAGRLAKSVRRHATVNSSRVLEYEVAGAGA